MIKSSQSRFYGPRTIFMRRAKKRLYTLLYSYNSYFKSSRSDHLSVYNFQWFDGKVKAKKVPRHADVWGSWGIPRRIPNLDTTEEGLWTASHHGRITPKVRTPVPLSRRLGGHHRQSRRSGETRTLTLLWIQHRSSITVFNKIVRLIFIYRFDKDVGYINTSESALYSPVFKLTVME
jgi:hypothetical protein